jgi:xylose dehydrogenase (NAD/NADP)
MIRFGILGTAGIAQRFLVAEPTGARITAVASRNRNRAESFSRKYGIPRFFDSYDALLDDPAIDAVYIPLPQHLHARYVIRSAQAGKHILVEKPAALTVDEATSMKKACADNGVLCMEAFMYRFKSLHRRIREIVRGGEIGVIRYINFNWCFNIHELDRSPFRLKKELGGGALYDLGIYGIDFLRFLTGLEPVVHAAFLRREHHDGVDMFVHAALTVGDIFATVTAGFDNDANAYTISGERGSVHVPGSLSGRAVENTLQAHFLGGDRRSEETFPPENPYIAELGYFAECIQQHRQPEADLNNSISNLRVVEKIFAVARPITKPLS